MSKLCEIQNITLTFFVLIFIATIDISYLNILTHKHTIILISPLHSTLLPVLISTSNFLKLI